MNHPYDVFDASQPDATGVVPVNMGLDVNTDVIDSIVVTNGSYRLHFNNPVREIFLSNPINTNAVYYNKSGFLETKELIVDNISIDLKSNSGTVDITVKENSITLAVVWGAVIVASSIAVAFSVESILTKIEKLVPKSMSWVILLLIGLSLITPIAMVMLKNKK